MPGLFDGLGATTLPAPPPTLASFIGQLPASLNLLRGFANDGKTQTGQFTDFTIWDNNSNLSITTGLASFDGTSNCQKLIATSTNGNHIAQFNALAPQLVGTPHTFRHMAIAKAAEYTRIVLAISCFEFTNSTASFGFDLAGGNTNYDQVIGANITVVGGTATITSLTEGFYLCYFDYFFNSNNSFGGSAVITPQIFLDNGSGTGARSISFAGNGTNGVEVLLCSLLPTPLWSYNSTPVFSDDFTNLSTIDINNTKATGFNWYVNNLFPDTIYSTFGFATNPPSVPTPSRNLTQPATSITQLWDPTFNNPNAGWNTQLMSFVDNGAGGYNGTVFQGPNVFEIIFQFSGGLLSQFNPTEIGDGPTFWTMSAECFINPTPPVLKVCSGAHMLEWDFCEANPITSQIICGSSGGFDHYDPASPQSHSFGLGQGKFTNMDLNQFARVTSVWINSFSDPNALGWGALYTFVNGLGGNPPNPQGVYNRISDIGLAPSYSPIWENHHFPLLIVTDGSGGNPNLPWIPPGGRIMQIDRVNVYAPISVPTLYNYMDISDAGADITLNILGLIVNTGSGTNWESIRSVSGKTSGKWYWEITVSGAGIATANSVMLGIMSTNASITTPANPGSSAQGAGLEYNTAANTNVNGVTGDYTGSITWAANDVIGFALDLGAGKCWIHKNGTWLNGTPGSATDVWSGITAAHGPWYAAIGAHSITATATANFGATAFAFTIPSGYTGWTQ